MPLPSLSVVPGRPPQVSTPVLTCIFCGGLIFDVLDVHVVAMDALDRWAVIACGHCHATLLPEPMRAAPGPLAVVR